MTCQVEKDNEELKKLIERLRETIRDLDRKIHELIVDAKQNPVTPKKT